MPRRSSSARRLRSSAAWRSSRVASSSSSSNATGEGLRAADVEAVVSTVAARPLPLSTPDLADFAFDFSPLVSFRLAVLTLRRRLWAVALGPYLLSDPISRIRSDSGATSRCGGFDCRFSNAAPCQWDFGATHPDGLRGYTQRKINFYPKYPKTGRLTTTLTERATGGGFAATLSSRSAYSWRYASAASLAAFGFRGNRCLHIRAMPWA